MSVGGIILIVVVTLVFIGLMALVAFTPSSPFFDSNFEQMTPVSEEERSIPSDSSLESIIINDTYRLWNPSILRRGDGMVKIYRMCYSEPTEKIPESLETKMFLDLGDDDLPLHQRKDVSGIVWDNNGEWKSKMMDPAFYSSTARNNGLEDPRLFTWNGEEWCIMSYRSRSTYKGSCHKIAMLKLSDPDKLYRVEYKHSTKFEKNWLPFERDGDLFFVYTSLPLQILKLKGFRDSTDAEFAGVYELEFFSESPTIKCHFRLSDGVGGSSCPVPITLQGVGESYLFLAHTRGFVSRARRKSFFVIFKKDNFELLGVGREISVHGSDIEFASGMIYNEDSRTVTCSFGIADAFSLFECYSLREVFRTVSFRFPQTWNDFRNVPAYVINMRRNIERWESCVSQIQNHFPHFERFEAVDAVRASPAELAEKWIEIVGREPRFSPRDSEMVSKPGRQGCLLSHYAIWKKIVRESIPYAVIFEDDIVFDSNFETLAPKFYDATEKTVDLFYLGSQFSTQSSNMTVKTPCFCTHAYAVSLNGARKLMALCNADKFDIEVDCQIIEEMKLDNPSIKWECWNNKPQQSLNIRVERSRGLIYQSADFVSEIG
jgi:GR25 family glycosyltransferase involved in LPS biosynthesis